MKFNLSDVCEYRKGKINVNELTSKTYISTANMLPNKNGVSKSDSLPTVKMTQKYKKGDVLVSNIRPYFKKVWQAKWDGGCSNDVLVFQARPTVESEFLYYLLSSDEFFSYAMANSKGTKMPRGDKNAIMRYPIPIFERSVQKKIVSVLKPIDNLIELNNQINNNLAA